ncbi:MAG: hypothetical protein CMJ78_16560 [Planctomycetaceae bacterium]|nr:hypothetical protein [Planctomycetaceae bacterium]
MHGSIDAELPWSEINDRLISAITELESSKKAFQDCSQARAVVDLVFQSVAPAYKAHHQDLLFHLNEREWQQSFLLVRMFEAVLSAGPFDQVERVCKDAVKYLNDYVGFRPVAVLENGRKMEIYDHERFRCVPLYIKEAGVATGRYHDLIASTMRFLENASETILVNAYFHLKNLEELSLDVRAHDHEHPVNKRTNYMFGEWDPHLINTRGFFTRFVLRKSILDSLQDWIDNNPGNHEEVLYDASAVLTGTMLMASAISGYGPDTHDSTISLTSLLPIVARQRDTFYQRLMIEAEGARADRLRREAEVTQQPFGHVRQALNLHLALYGARQIQHRHLAQLFARMGYASAAREQAAIIPATSIRIECEIQCNISVANRQVDEGEVRDALNTMKQIEELIHRGINCGALVDPWNILGFQGQFPLFHSRDDSIPDQRVEILLDLIERTFSCYSRLLIEAAAQGLKPEESQIAERFENLAIFWDRFATTTIDELQEVFGVESFESARHVARAISEWLAAGESSGDIGFWREHVSQFESAKAYAQVVSTLLDKGDHLASMGLLIQWLSEAETARLESGSYSIFSLLIRWMNQVCRVGQDGNPQEAWPVIRRLFDYLEANSGEYWVAPTLDEALGNPPSAPVEEPFAGTADDEDSAFGDFYDQDEDDLYKAAYDEVVYKDSAEDGIDGQMMDGGYSMEMVEFEAISREIEPRLKFITTLAQLWQITVSGLVSRERNSPAELSHAELAGQIDTLKLWARHARSLQAGLLSLLNSIWDYQISTPSGDHDSNVEFDMNLQTKFYIVHTIISTHINCRVAELSLLSWLDEDDVDLELNEVEVLTVQVYRSVLQRDLARVNVLLPKFLSRLRRDPLLYIPLDNGGHPKQILAARTVQTDVRFLLSQLPRLGLIRETYHVLQTAHRMERESRPNGLAVTEFDRIFRTALRNSLECVINSSRTWQAATEPPEFPAEGLVEIVQQIIDHYKDQWHKHSRTMRLSTVEGLKSTIIWDEVKEFIETYGADLFHAKMLTLGNVRAILHNGIEWFLETLAETENKLNPIKLLDDLQEDVIDEEHVIEMLELIYGSVVDKFDRFLEYNTTTTQSDYGEMFYFLLEFLRVEAEYDREAWDFIPQGIAHEVLSQCEKDEAVRIWEERLEKVSAKQADMFIDKLEELEKSRGIQLPSISDRLRERFVRPLAVNRMLALIPKSIEDAHLPKSSAAFRELRTEIEEYLNNTSGSGIDVAPWLIDLEKEVDRFDEAIYTGPPHKAELSVKAPPIPVSLDEMRRQLKIWNQPLAKRKKGKTTRRKKREG